MTRRELWKLPVAAAAGSAVVRFTSAATPYSTPGLFPGRVVGVKHSGANGPNFTYQPAPVRLMIRRGIMELTGQRSHIAAWRRLFQPGDVVGIKVNGNASPAMITSPAALVEIITGLILAGVRPADVLVFERYQDSLTNVLNTAPGRWLPAGVRTAWSTPGGYLNDQTGMDGYDPNYYVELPQFLCAWQSPDNPSHTRSYISKPITQVKKLISLTTLKAHNTSGVTLALKNCAIGGHNNCNRFHDKAPISIKRSRPWRLRRCCGTG